MTRLLHKALPAVIAVVFCAHEAHAQASAKAFAAHGTEKMIYDARMEPQALLHKDILYIVYQADRSKSIGNPHIISYDTKRRQYS